MAPAPCNPGSPRIRSSSRFVFWLHRWIWFGGFPHSFDDLLHSFLDRAHLGMNFLDQITLGLGEPLQATRLLLKPLEHGILTGGNPVHPPKAHDPSERIDPGKHVNNSIPVHDIYMRGLVGNHVPSNPAK